MCLRICLYEEFGGGHFSRQRVSQKPSSVRRRKLNPLISLKLFFSGNGRIPISQEPSFRAARTSSFWQMTEETIIPGYSAFRTISGNPRQFNYRDESVGLCVSAQKYNNKNLFLISPDSCICFRKKAGQICVENQEHLVL